MKTAIIGLPMTGKTSLFAILTGVAQESRIGSTAVRTGIAKVPDPRVNALAESRWNRGGLLQQGPTRHLRPAQANFGTAPLAISDKQHIANVQVADDPLRDLTQRSLNAHEVPRRDVHLAAAEAATFAVQMPCQNQCDRESAERCGAPHGERHAVARSGDGGALGRFGLAAQGEELPQNRWPSRSVGVGHDLGPSTSSSANRRRS